MNLIARARDLLQDGRQVAIVRLERVRGSAPREEGTLMLVTAEGIFGTIGGGTMEWKAIAEAQRLLLSGGKRSSARYLLGPDLGQCCGGQVEVVTTVADVTALNAFAAEEQDETRTLFLFGAGHVGRALVLILAQSPFHVVWCDARPGAFPAAVPANVSLRSDVDVPGVLTGAPEGSMALVMTHSHALDLAIVDACLRNTAIAATGLIGSATKRTRFEKRLAEAGVLPERIAALICPIGLGGIRSKRPDAIAISTAAQLVALDESLKLGEASPQNVSQSGSAAS